MEVYFAPSAGTITNLNNVSTEALRVGLSTILLDINASTFDILTNVRMTGNLNISNGGVIRNDTNPSTQNDILAGPGLTLSIGGSTAVPPYSINRCGNANALPVVATLYTGTIGQEIFFIYSEANTGTFRINGFNNNLVLTGAGTNLDLTALGQSVHLLSIDDGAGGGVWYVVGGTGYTVS